MEKTFEPDRLAALLEEPVVDVLTEGFFAGSGAGSGSGAGAGASSSFFLVFFAFFSLSA